MVSVKSAKSPGVSIVSGLGGLFTGSIHFDCFMGRIVRYPLNLWNSRTKCPDFLIAVLGVDAMLHLWHPLIP